MLTEEQKEKYAERAQQWKAKKSGVVAKKVNRRMNLSSGVKILVYYVLFHEWQVAELCSSV